MFNPRKNQEGYWIANHVVEQLKTKAIPIFNALFPNCIAVFAFDNSSNHGAYSDDALIANRMLLNDGGGKLKNLLYAFNCFWSK